MANSGGARPYPDPNLSRPLFSASSKNPSSCLSSQTWLIYEYYRISVVWGKYRTTIIESWSWVSLNSQNDFLFIPECTVFNQSQDYALIYLPEERCTPGSTLTWAKNTAFEEHMTQTRELFYRYKELLWYAGTFQCSNASNISTKSYQALGKSVCFTTWLRGHFLT